MKKKKHILLMAGLLGFLLFTASCSDKSTKPADEGDPSDPSGQFDESGLTRQENDGSWDSSVIVYRDDTYDHYFTRFEGFTGADAAYSTLLPNGDIFWSFGDSWFGKVSANRSRDATTSFFVRNAAMVQHGECFDCFSALNDHGPQSAKTLLLHKQDPDHWYWPYDATVHDNKLHFLISHVTKTEEGGMWGFKTVGSDLAIFSLPELSLDTIIADKYKGEATFGSCLLEDGDYTYIYGTVSGYLSKRVSIARAPQGDLTADWEFWNGTGWQSSPSDYTMPDLDASDQFSVFKVGDTYYLFTQEILFGTRLFLYEGDSPSGPFTNKRILYNIPTQFPETFTYNALVHPELSKQGELVISYCINTNNFQDQFTNADTYRPYFLRIRY
ncbi:hypothetical protein GCM10011386_24360 [Parapedobacter defluvii]|uniref:DUF4185 domain-containing protein n=1 Tax=Parapedobacter defluvii TaxID=2045106 RepID=A0ABQ1M201_9SPHI|nr:DUF5005 domain-containing protein [Parapedobacter defluvii]RQP09720.1 MAG: DUF5005 domain-containing protein [Parapedobacter sp.]GGC31435.1 hypothetical protein GCM10011386_24360 [Parapedobacter defluvii]